MLEIDKIQMIICSQHLFYFFGNDIKIRAGTRVDKQVKLFTIAPENPKVGITFKVFFGFFGEECLWDVFSLPGGERGRRE